MTKTTPAARYASTEREEPGGLHWDSVDWVGRIFMRSIGSKHSRHGRESKPQPSGHGWAQRTPVLRFKGVARERVVFDPMSIPAGFSADYGVISVG